MSELDWNILLPGIITILPHCLWITFILLLALIFRKHLSALFSRLTKFGAFGLEAEFVEDIRIELERAIKIYATGEDLIITEERLNSVLNHAKKVYDELQGARILWVDRHPFANASIHRFLNDLGVNIDNTEFTHQAIEAIKWSAGAYEVVITNWGQKDENGNYNGEAGAELISAIQELIPGKQIILFIMRYDPDLGTPKGVRVVTNQVDTLLHHIFGAITLEHSKGKKTH